MANSNYISKICIEKIEWRPEKTSTIPLYKQIFDFVRDSIACGSWSIGSKLPTQTELARLFDVNRSTIIEVYDELKSEGLVESRKSSGTIIVNNTWSLLASSAVPDWSKYIKRSSHKANLNVIKIINDLEIDEKFIRLSAGELSRKMYPAEFMENIYENLLLDFNYMGYEEPKGLLPLREEVCKYLKSFGIEAEASKVLIVSGALQAFHLIATGILHRNSSILTESPSYLNSLTLFESHGINLLGAKTDREGINLEDLIRKVAVKKPQLLYLIPCFQNPTGTLMSEERRREILDLCERERLPIIEDDTYRELWLDEEPPCPIKSYDFNGTVLYLGSMSKTLSAGLRVGWIVGNENVIDRLSDIKMQTDYGSSSVSQWMCYEFFSKGYYKEFIEGLRPLLREKRDFVIDILEKHFSDIAEWDKPKGGFYIWLTLKNEVAMYRLFEHCYKEGIIINPGNIYEPSNNRNIRLSYAYAEKADLEKGLVILSGIIRNLWHK